MKKTSKTETKPAVAPAAAERWPAVPPERLVPRARLASFLTIDTPNPQHFMICGVQMMLITGGRLRALLPDGRWITATEGDLVTFYSGENRYVAEGPRPMAFYQVHFEPAREPLHLGVPAVEGVGMLPHWLPQIRNRDQAASAFEKAIMALHELGPLWELEFSAAVTDLVRLAFENREVSRSPRRGSLSVWDRVVVRLEMADEAVTIRSLAAEFGMGVETFIRGFHRHAGVTPKQFLLQRRLWRARRQLLDGMPVKQAALGNGFRDPQYFSRLYRRFFGFAPTATGENPGSLPFDARRNAPIGRMLAAPGEDIERFRLP